jgi:hypothetical protein
LLEKAYDLGVRFEKYSGSCSQCTVAALREILGFEDIIVKVATSSCGGQAGLSTGACGGIMSSLVQKAHVRGETVCLIALAIVFAAGGRLVGNGPQAPTTNARSGGQNSQRVVILPKTVKASIKYSE